MRPLRKQAMKCLKSIFQVKKFTPEEVILGISKGVKEGKIYPVFCGDAQLTDGVESIAQRSYLVGAYRC